jgi:hypothetical protein
LFSCCKTSDKCSNILEDFNQTATAEFDREYSKYDFGPLHDQYQCILKQAVANDLDELNNWHLTVVDSFYIRTYAIEMIGTYFAFIRCKNSKVYFIMLPKLQPYFVCSQDVYTCESGACELIDDRNSSLKRVDSEMLDVFMQKQVFSSGTTKEQFSQSRKILPSLFPGMLTKELGPTRMLDLLESASYSLNTRSAFQKLVDSDSHLSPWSSNMLIYECDRLGYLIFNFSKTSSHSLSMETYLIPSKQKETHMFESLEYKYPMCWK